MTGRGWPYERYGPAPVPVPDRRYDCGGCSFATVDRARMLGHFHATGHAAAPAMPVEPMTEAAAGRVARAYDAFEARADSGGPGTAAGLVDAVEAARTVALSPAVELALYAALAAAEPGQHHAAARAGLRAVFEVLGLRVVES